MYFTRHVLSGAVLVAVTATVSLAQVRQLQQTGQAMDANMQVGSGGSNRPVQGYVPINGNDIMSGNVSGLSYFHGPVGSNLGMGYVITPSGLSAFHTSFDSPNQFQGYLGSSSLNSFARQSAGGPYGMTQTYYLPSSVVSGSQGAMYSAPMGGGFDSSLIPRTSISPVANSSPIYSGQQSQVINLAAPAAPLQPGAPGAVLSSPIFVLRTTEQPMPSPDIALPTTAPATRPASAMPAPEGDNTKTPDNPAMVQGAVNSGHDDRISGQSAEVKMALVSENYLKLAEELKANGAPVAGNENKSPGNEVAGGMDNTARSGADLDPLTGKPRLMATLPSLSAGRAGTGAATQGAKQPDIAPSAKRLVEMTDAELLAGGKVKPVKLAPAQGSGAVASGYDMMMLRAETNLKAAKFLLAADSYQAALSMKPDDPLALVGRGHAELGAGYYSEAEFDLKFVYTRKPELVAVKYDVDSFIPAGRQLYLLEDLQKMTAKSETANMASFLYCYLCYETSRGPELQAELKRWSARTGHDEWQSVVARAWTTK